MIKDQKLKNITLGQLDNGSFYSMANMASLPCMQGMSISHIIQDQSPEE